MINYVILYIFLKVTEAMHALYYLAEEASESNVTRRSMKSTLGLMELMKKIEQRYDVLELNCFICLFCGKFSSCCSSFKFLKWIYSCYVDTVGVKLS